MFLCRTGRLSAAALDTAFKSSGSFRQRVSANRLGDVTLTLRNANTLQRHRCFCVSVSGVEASLAHLQQRQQQKGDWQPVQSREWTHLDRTVNLSKRVQSEGGYVDVIRRVNRRHDSRAELMVHGVFTGDWELSSRLLSTGTMQVRGLSTQRREASEEQPANNKEGVQNINEASATSSPPAAAQREQEPEGGKPNKTQQLKTVFKEYGAVGVSFHITISLMSLGMFYLLISSGIDMAAVLCKLGFSEAVVRSKMAAGTSTFVLAYAIHKLFAPVRISITLVSVPLIVRYFRKTGHFKPPTPAP